VGCGGRSRLAAARRADSEAERPGSMGGKMRVKRREVKLQPRGKDGGKDGEGRSGWGALPTLTGEGSPVKVMGT
jgi:hypothetical protein